MVTDAPTPMSMDTARTTIDADMLSIAQWLSPAFPIGSFAYSHGLEQAIANSWVRNATDLTAWLRALLEQGTLGCDAVLLATAYRTPPNGWAELNAEARAFAASRERQIEAERQGRAFVQTVNAVWTLDLPDGLLLPVAIGAAANRRGLPCRTTGAMMLQANVTNLVLAAQRLAPIGQTEAQHIIADLQPVILDVMTEAQSKGLDDLSAISFRSDIAAMQHETLQPRIFTT